MPNGLHFLLALKWCPPVSLIAAGVQVKICSLFPVGLFLFFFSPRCHHFSRLSTCFLGSNSQLSFGILHSTPSMIYKSSINTPQGPYCTASIWQYSNFDQKQQLQWEHANRKYHQLGKWVPVGEILQTTSAHLSRVATQKAGGWVLISQEPMGLMRFFSIRTSSGLITTVWYICNDVFCKNKQQLSDEGTMGSRVHYLSPAYKP